MSRYAIVSNSDYNSIPVCHPGNKGGEIAWLARRPCRRVHARLVSQTALLRTFVGFREKFPAVFGQEG